MTPDRAAPAGRHVPALDGIRALAVVAVLAFHAGYGWASGGFLGVSVFFTLSGYLITSLLLGERARDGRNDLRGFYRRRAARLLPASLLGLVAALVVGHASTTVPPDLHGDVLAALAQVANWRWLASSQSYQDLFATPSPVLHFWSLAIEEQFYLLFPPAFVWAVGRSRQRLRIVLVAGLLTSWLLLAGLLLADLRDAAYYATPARLGELLVGCLLACVAAPARLASRAPRLGRAGAPALAALALGVVAADPGGRWSYAWLPVTAVASACLIVAATGPGWIGRLLSRRPLVGLGRISYGVYVFHWPIYLYLTPDRTGLGPTALTAARVAATLAVALASHRFVEVPILRRARAPRVRRDRRLVPALVAGWAVVAAVVVVAPEPGPPPTDLEAATRTLEAAAAGPVDPGVPRIAYFGDSTAAVLSYALVRWGGPVDKIAVAGSDVPLGCGLELPGSRRMRGKEIEINPTCFERVDRWPAVLRESGAPVAVLQTGVWEATDHRFPGQATWAHLGDPDLERAYEIRFLEVVDSLVAAGASRVVWLTSPPVDVTRGTGVDTRFPEADPARMDRYNALVRRVADQRPAVVVLDYAAQVAAWTPAQDEARRVDGIHLTDEAALELVETWLGPALLAVHQGLGPPS